MGQYMQDKLHDFSLNLQAVQNYFVPHLGGLCSEDSSSFKNANYTIVLKFFFFFFLEDVQIQDMWIHILWIAVKV